MPALTPEKVKQIVLGALLALVAVVLYLTQLLLPARQEAARLRHGLEISREHIRLASSELKTLQAREIAARAEFPLHQFAQQLQATMPNPYIVEAPLAIKEVLHQRGIHEIKPTLFLLLPLAGLPDYLASGWSVSIQKADALEFGEALADLENRFPLGQLTDLSLRANNDADNTVGVSLIFQVAVQP